NMIAKITNAIRIRLDIISRNAPPRPRWDSNAAIPSPAAMPANGPRKRDMPLLAAVPAAAAPGAAADEALRCVVVAAGGAEPAGRLCVTREACLPKLFPPPKRRASASKDIDTMPTALTARLAMAQKRDIRLLFERTVFELTPSGAPGQGKWNGRNGGPTKGEQAIAYVYLNSSVILTGTQY